MGSRRQKNICSCKPLKANPASLLHFNYPAVRSPPRTSANVSSETFLILKGQAQRLAAAGRQRSGSEGCTPRRASRHQLSPRCPSADPHAALARLTAALSPPLKGLAWLFMEGGNPASRGQGLPCSPCSAGSGQAHPSTSLQRWRVAKPFVGRCPQVRPPTASPAVIAASAFQPSCLFPRIQKHLPGRFFPFSAPGPPPVAGGKG